MPFDRKKERKKKMLSFISEMEEAAEWRLLYGRSSRKLEFGCMTEATWTL